MSILSDNDGVHNTILHSVHNIVTTLNDVLTKLYPIIPTPPRCSRVCS